MIDSIIIFQPLDYFEIKSVLENITNVKEIENCNTGEITYSGTTSNSKLFIKIQLNRIRIHGSLSQYYFNTTESLNWITVDLAIGKLEAELKIKFSHAIASGLDLEGTIATVYKPNSYFEYFGYSAYFNRFVEKNTLYYSTGNRKKRFYNKSQKNKKDLGIITSSNINLLRFEISYKRKALKKLCKKLNLDNLKLYDLKEPIIQRELTNTWLDEYNSISKNDLSELELSNIKGLADLKNTLLIDHINLKYGGINGVLSAISRNNDIDSKVKYRIRANLESLLDQAPIAKIPKHIEEIDSLINQYYQLLIASIKHL